MSHSHNSQNDMPSGLHNWAITIGGSLFVAIFFLIAGVSWKGPQGHEGCCKETTECHGKAGCCAEGEGKGKMECKDGKMEGKCHHVCGAECKAAGHCTHKCDEKCMKGEEAAADTAKPADAKAADAKPADAKPAEAHGASK